MSNQHPLELLQQLVDSGGCRLLHLPEKIWVYGGPCDPHREGRILSLRDAFWRATFSQLPSKPWFGSLDRPEDHEEWWAFSGYSDLLEFERDACYLAKSVILFSESPGSHAELGALALDDSILTRLFVVIHGSFLEGERRRSFLNLGPIKRIRDNGGECVINSVDPGVMEIEDCQVVVDCYDQFYSGLGRRSAAFNKKDPTHVLLLIADLVDLLLVVKQLDIESALTFFQVDYTEQQVKKSLMLLYFFEFIGKKERGREVFWTKVIRSDAPWFDYKARDDGARFDRSRFKVTSQRFIEEDAKLSYIYRGVV